MANKIGGSLNNSIWYNTNLGKETKTRMHKSVIRSMFTYDCECQQINWVTEIRNKNHWGKIGSSSIREEYEIEPVNSW